MNVPSSAVGDEAAGLAGNVAWPPWPVIRRVQGIIRTLTLSRGEIPSKRGRDLAWGARHVGVGWGMQAVGEDRPWR